MKKHFLMSLHHICQTCYEMRAYSEGASPTRGLFGMCCGYFVSVRAANAIENSPF